MTPELRRIGAHASPVVVIDRFSGDASETVAIAEALAPFPPARGVYYPGVRRILDESDGAAWEYVTRTLTALAPFIGGAFDVDGFNLIEASFSMVTAAPATLFPAQRAPHFDSTDPDYLAVLHYLSGPPDAGTAFYRQRSTGIERVDPGNVDSFVAAAKRESPELEGYTCASNRHFDQVAAIEGPADRLVVYQGCLLHSGIIPPDLTFSAAPRDGRLTANLFVRGRRS
jgi:hypothetical protein